MSHPVAASVTDLLNNLDGVVRIDGDHVEILDERAIRDEMIDRLVWAAVFGDEHVQTASRWLIRVLAPALGAWPASIHELYMAAGRGEYRNITTPAINVRTMTYDVTRTIFRAAQATDTKQVILELARSEMGYTEQRPAEYASSVLAAAIKENWQGPVFIQGDHYQANAKKYADDPAAEIEAVRALAVEAVRAGYGNIDIDASTLVDLSYDDLKDQQRLNSVHTAELTKAIRAAEPEGMTISIGGEIGEVGKENSTVPELEAFMDGYLEELAQRGRDMVGISKISVQTGTSHGGVVDAAGELISVMVDFETLGALSKVSKERYGTGGAVQHGASTLPESAFSKFAEADAVEVHLATAFQNAIYDSTVFPADLTEEITAYLHANHSDERKPDQTDAQFLYETRKRAFGPFKRQLWSLPEEAKATIMSELRARFELIFRELNVAGNAHLVDRFITRQEMPASAPDAIREAATR